MDMVFDEEPTVPMHQFNCKKCKKHHHMDLELYKQIVQLSRLVVHCTCGAAIEL